MSQTKQEIYLDNSATTCTYPEVSDLVKQISEENYGNTSSLHRKGMEAEQELRRARQILANLMKIDMMDLIFTSGGTESDNLAILGTAMANRRAGKRILISSIEHAAVTAPCAALEEFGFVTEKIPVESDGRINPQTLKEMLTDDTILVSTLYVNNEVGSLEPVEELAKVIHEYNPAIVYHVDATQAFGKYRIYPKRLGIDLMTGSSHKFHGPKGVGFLYTNRKTKLHPIILGGGHQLGMRSGTENVPGVAGMALAAKMIYQNLEEDTAKIRSLRNQLISGLQLMEDVEVNGSAEEKYSAPHIVSATFRGVRAEVLLHTLEDQGIYISAGSACSSNKPAVSATLKAIGLTGPALEQTVRFSLCAANTEEEIDRTLEVLRQTLPVLRRFVRK